MKISRPAYAAAALGTTLALGACFAGPTTTPAPGPATAVTRSPAQASVHPPDPAPVVPAAPARAAAGSAPRATRPMVPAPMAPPAVARAPIVRRPAPAPRLVVPAPIAPPWPQWSGGQPPHPASWCRPRSRRPQWSGDQPPHPAPWSLPPWSARPPLHLAGTIMMATTTEDRTTVTATGSPGSALRWRRRAAGLVVGLIGTTSVLAASGCAHGPAGQNTSAPEARAPAFAWFHAGPAPAGWRSMELPDGTAVLPIPPTQLPCRATAGPSPQPSPHRTVLSESISTQRRDKAMSPSRIGLSFGWPTSPAKTPPLRSGSRTVPGCRSGAAPVHAWRTPTSHASARTDTGKSPASLREHAVAVSWSPPRPPSPGTCTAPCWNKRSPPMPPSRRTPSRSGAHRQSVGFGGRKTGDWTTQCRKWEPHDQSQAGRRRLHPHEPPFPGKTLISITFTDGSEQIYSGRRLNGPMTRPWPSTGRRTIWTPRGSRGRPGKPSIL